MNVKHYCAALTAFLIWGLFSLVLRPLAAYSSYDILFYRILFATGAIWMVSLCFRRKATKSSIKHLRSLNVGQKRKVLGNYVLSAIMLALNWYLFIYAMNRISVNSTSLAYLICPIVTTILASIFLKERLRTGQWIAVSLSVIACFLLSLGHFTDLAYSFMIALTYAVYLILQKVNPQDKLFSLTIHISISALILLPALLSQDSKPPTETSFYAYTFVIATVFTVIPLFLNAYALKGLSSSVVGVLLYINPVIAFILAITYFKEEVTGLQMIAYLLIFVSVVLFNMVYLADNRKQLS